MEILDLKKEITQAVSWFLLISLIVSCKTSSCIIDKTKRGGEYTVTKKQSSNKRTVISGQFLNEQNKPLPVNPIINGIILDAKKDGVFSTYVHPGSYNIAGVFIGYKWICTKDINVTRGDSLFIHLKMEVDDQPLEGKN